MKRGISLAVLVFALFPTVLTQAQTRPATTAILIKMTIAQIARDGSADATRLVSLVNHPPQSGPLPTTDPRESLSIAIVNTEISQTFEKLQKAGKVNVLARPFVTSKADQLHTLIINPQGQVHLDHVPGPPPTGSTIQYADPGLLVDMIPHISPDGLVILDVAKETTTLTKSTVQVSKSVSAPIFTRRSSQSRVTVPNGQTIVISGIMSADQTTNATSDVLIFMTLSLDG